MNTPTASWPSPAHDPVAAQHALAEQVRNTVAIARALAGMGREVEIVGLDRMVGLLCAKTLDLPPDDGRAARPGLSAILAEIELLNATLRAKAPP